MKPRPLMLCLLMILAMVAVTAYYYPALPPTVPTHWNAAGQIDAYGPRWHVWLIGPVAMSLIVLLAVAGPWLSPQKFEVASFATTYSYLMTLPVLLFAGIESLMLAVALGAKPDMARLVPLLVFVLLILMGNPMGKVRRNFFMGIRTPWTLASERVWYATHRLAGRLMVGSGLLGLLAVLAQAPSWMLLILMLAWPLIAVGYSLSCYKRLQKNHQLEIH